MTYSNLINQFLEKATNESKWSEVKSWKIVTSETELDDDGIFPKVLDEYYMVTSTVGTWITRKQKSFLISLAKSTHLQDVDGVEISFGFSDRKTGASTLKFTKRYREEILRTKKK